MNLTNKMKQTTLDGLPWMEYPIAHEERQRKENITRLYTKNLFYV